MIQSWDQSKTLLARARQSLAGGVSSPFRAKAPVPLYFADGCGARGRQGEGSAEGNPAEPPAKAPVGPQAVG